MFFHISQSSVAFLQSLLLFVANDGNNKMSIKILLLLLLLLLNVRRCYYISYEMFSLIIVIDKY